ncbi:hypothetical protein [Flavobacterium psychrophilum]|uniref:hypothetical protein n=2 Tax=Flavobacterium psychrophilum TaxID=96345 RepID=UPI000B7C43FE|nr:hypothetical protein [Flavobacterium psychrophilum]MCB5994129.1 hypothetical protein [Flavobacterium psychrophilum]MCB5997061.1 hypothetical protein [Flavobacterium psychrophilum]MCB6007232.1 hypothetical protein [Flavobacterium psychrophilum]MCB6019150.1 hypothetical protein [Flavobacterium psychrophilum]MCB6041921.1 hypothetical protein [Flavobacterium psychrophilum]
MKLEKSKKKYSNLNKLIKRVFDWLFNCKKKASLQIVKYSESSLAEALSNKYTSPEVISNKNHFIYLKGYLGSPDMDTKTIMIEENYMSKDFLHDYASYYSLCFEEYPKFCKRVHFFSNDFDEDKFKEIIQKSEQECKDFWNHYLGFVVIKPIPVTILGFTVLKTYSNGANFTDRNFWGVRQYKVHLFGNEVELTSLAFQEQDSVLAACATTAIWSMLNKASVDFHTILKSPSQITKDADNTSFDGSRLFPNKGLNLLQICQAILNSGLVSEIKQPDFRLIINDNNSINIVSNQYLKKILNAYSPIGIPIILIISVPTGTVYGLHAITISGFKQKAPVPISPKDETSWLSENIEKFYAHDDQWGPFAKIEFGENNSLETPWTSFHVNRNPTYVTNIVVPIYPKIRISYEDIESIVLGLDAILTIFFEDKIKYDLIWDIKITYSEDIKKNIKNSNLYSSEKLTFLTKSLPKYVWVASCYIGEDKIFDFIFDATDVNSGMIGKDFICYISDIKPILSEFLTLNRNYLRKAFHGSKLVYYDFLIQNLKL